MPEPPKVLKELWRFWNWLYLSYCHQVARTSYLEGVPCFGRNVACGRWLSDDPFSLFEITKALFDRPFRSLNASAALPVKYFTWTLSLELFDNLLFREVFESSIFLSLQRFKGCSIKFLVE